MKTRSRTRTSTWLLAAALALGATSSTHAIDTGVPPPPQNNCVYCIRIFGWVICITTTQPIPGGDPLACQF